MSSSYRKAAASEGGFAATLALFLLVILAAAVSVPYFVLGKVVPPDQIGVRRNLFGLPGMESGFSSEGLPPGLHWQIPGFSEVWMIPRGVQYVTFSKGPQSLERTSDTLLIPTTDGSKVETDVSLIIRFFEQPGGPKNLKIVPDEQLQTRTDLEAAPKAERKNVAHGGPKALIERYNLDLPKILQKVAEVSENELKQSLSRLSTRDYYNPVSREKAALEAQERLAESLGKDGIELWGTLIRRYRYAEQKLDDQIFAKNLQEQTEKLNAALSRLAEAKAKTEKEQASWDAKIQSLRVEGQAKADVIQSQAALYESSKKAEADLLVDSAKAEVDTRRSSALSEMQGADVYVAKELAPLLKSLRGGVVSDVDPYDVDAWIRKLIGDERRPAQ